jgi:hypothetical protein
VECVWGNGYVAGKDNRPKHSNPYFAQEGEVDDSLGVLAKAWENGWSWGMKNSGRDSVVVQEDCEDVCAVVQKKTKKNGSRYDISGTIDSVVRPVWFNP